MFKKIKNLLGLNKKQQEQFDLVVRPMIIYAITLLIIMILTIFDIISFDFLKGYVSSFIAYGIINLINIAFIGEEDI